jgi:hypothetical protein
MNVMRHPLQYLARKVGLYRRRKRDGQYWHGHGRKWRVNDKNEFQMGDDNFDRWANSVEVSGPCPRNLRELRETVREYLRLARAPL